MLGNMINPKWDLRQCLVHHQGLVDAFLSSASETVRALFHVWISPLLLADVLSNLRKLLAADCHHLHQKGKPRKYHPAMDMALHRQTAQISPPMMASVSCIFAEMYLKPTGTS